MAKKTANRNQPTISELFDKLLANGKLKLYNSEQVEAMIRKSIQATIEGLREWLEKETIIVNTKTKKKIPNATIDVRKKGKVMTSYVYPKLAKQGIKFTPIENK